MTDHNKLPSDQADPLDRLLDQVRPPEAPAFFETRLMARLREEEAQRKSGFWVQLGEWLSGESDPVKDLRLPLPALLAAVCSVALLAGVSGWYGIGQSPLDLESGAGGASLIVEKSDHHTEISNEFDQVAQSDDQSLLKALNGQLSEDEILQALEEVNVYVEESESWAMADIR